MFVQQSFCYGRWLRTHKAMALAFFTFRHGITPDHRTRRACPAVKSGKRQYAYADRWLKKAYACPIEISAVLEYHMLKITAAPDIFLVFEEVRLR